MTLKEEIESVTHDDILEALGDGDVSMQDILKASAYYAKSDSSWIPAKVVGRMLAQVANHMMRVEEALGKGRPMDAGPPPRAPRRAPVPPQTTPGTLSKKAIDAGLPDNLEVGQVLDIPCPDCGSIGMKLKATTKDPNAKRTFLSCMKWTRGDPDSCKGSISYKAFT